MEKKNKLHLEIGDWIQGCHKYQNGNSRLSPPMYVVGIWDSAVYLEIDPEQGDPFEYEYEDLVPIELTDEILALNGILQDETGCWEKVEKEGYFISFMQASNSTYDVYITTNDTIDDHVNCRYVHQLQHFINMSGIDKPIKLQ